MKAFIEYVVKALVDYPDQVEVRVVDGDRTSVYELRLNPTDVGKVIGKQGRTIQSLRTLINGVSVKLGKRAMIEIIEDKPFVKPDKTSSTSPSKESAAEAPGASTTPTSPV